MVYNTVWYTIGKLIPSACPWCLRNIDTVYIKIIMGNSTVIIWNMAVKMTIIILIYMIPQFLKHHWSAEGIRVPIMHHTVLCTLYSACSSQFNHITSLVTMVTNIFPPKWCPCQPKSGGLSTISLLTRMPKNGEDWTQIGKTTVINCFIQ